MESILQLHSNPNTTLGNKFKYAPYLLKNKKKNEKENAFPTTVEAINYGIIPKVDNLIKISEYKSTLTFYLNGEKQIIFNPDPEGTLLDYLRKNDLKGTKLGCSEGGCGACTVVVAYIDPLDKQKIYYASINACIAPLISIEGKHLITVEGIGNTSNPHPVQERIAYFHGSQCGFCTPGIVMSLYALIRNTNGSPTENQISEAWDGNLCRCTGYKPILDAAKTFTSQSSCCQNSEQESSFSQSSNSQSSCCKSNVQSSCCKSNVQPSCCKSNVQSSCCKSNVQPSCCKSKKSGDSSPCSSSISENSSMSGFCCKSDSSLSSVSQNEITLKAPNGMPLKPALLPEQELIFPPLLRSYSLPPLYFGNEKKVWFRPVTKQQLLDIKTAYPNCKLVGGSSEIQIEIKMKAANYNVSVYANDIEELKGYKYTPGVGLEFGANISLSALEEVLHNLVSTLEPHKTKFFNAMLEQLKYFAGRQIRNAATPAGNIATASPISDLNPCFVAAEAELIIESATTKEPIKLSMKDFFLGYRKTALPADGFITKIFVRETTPYDYVVAYKQAKRKDDDIAIVTACLYVSLSEDNTNIVKNARLVYGGMAPITLAAKKSSDYLLGKDFTSPKTLEGTLAALEDDFNLPYGVPGGMPTYRRALAMSFFYKFYNSVLSDLELPHDMTSIKEVKRGLFVQGERDIENPFEGKILGKSNPHLSALKQVTGEAIYVDDIPKQHNELFGVQVLSSRPHAKILSVDPSAALEIDGVVAYVDINDLPDKKVNKWGTPNGLEDFFADGEVFFVGQTIGVILAEDEIRAAEGARAVKVEYEDLPFILTIEEAIEKNSFFELPALHPTVVKGDIKQGFKDAVHVFEGSNRIGAQEHFYLETQGVLVVPDLEDGEMKIYSSTQNPTETQHFVANATGVPDNRIVCRAKRLGGGFGGKETRAVALAGVAAVAAKKVSRPVRMILSRSEDMLTSGQRHPFLCKWKVGLDKDYKFVAIQMEHFGNTGWTVDLGRGVLERAVLHCDNVYNCPNFEVKGHLCKTNVASNTAFRGFGGPQGMFATESMIYEVADALAIDVNLLRSRNYYKIGQSTHFKQPITEDFCIPAIVEQLQSESDYFSRRKEVENFNKKSKWIKRGITTTPTKFGISFGALFLNQAGALVHIYHDGSVLLAHGGTEMGQGLFTKMAMVCAHELNVPLDNVFISETSTNTVANTSPTAASASSDLNGMAVKNACDQLNERLAPYRKKLGPDATMKEIAHTAYMDRVNLSANGFYKTPDINYVFGDPNPSPAFFYFTQGAAVSEVEVNTLSGDWTVLRTDIKMDIGRPINQAIDYGQIEGAYIQGQGLFTIEESLWLKKPGALFTRGPGAYKIPGFRDVPQIFNVSMLKDRDFSHLKTIHRSKGIGEPPLFLGSVVFFALREALKAARKEHLGKDSHYDEKKDIIHWNSPATSEQIRLTVGDNIVNRALVVPKEGDEPFFVAS